MSRPHKVRLGFLKFVIEIHGDNQIVLEFAVQPNGPPPGTNGLIVLAHHGQVDPKVEMGLCQVRVQSNGLPISLHRLPGLALGFQREALLVEPDTFCVLMFVWICHGSRHTSTKSGRFRSSFTIT